MTSTSIADSTRSYESLYSRRGREAPQPRIGDPRDSAKMITFLYGYPDAGTLPKRTVAEAAVRALETEGEWALQYGNTTGAPCLIDTLREKLQRDQGIVAKPEQVLITRSEKNYSAIRASSQSLSKC